MDETLEKLRRRLTVTNGKYGTWLTCTEAAALLQILEEQKAVRSAPDGRMIEGPPQHRMVPGPQKTKANTR